MLETLAQHAIPLAIFIAKGFVLAAMVTSIAIIAISLTYHVMDKDEDK